MTAATRRDVGNVPAAEPLEQLLELGRLVADLGHKLTGPAAAGRVKVENQEAPGPRSGVVNRHSARLARRVGGQRPGMPGRVGPAAVTRDPDALSTGEGGRDRMPGSLRAARERPVRRPRNCFRVLRRVARGQC